MAYPVIVGHRGARNLWPENSLGGFRNLLSLPVEAVEFDVHLSAAGELLVIHDATLDRTTERSGRVCDLAEGEYRSVILKSSSEPIPTLDEVLQIYAATDHILHVELKADAEGRPYEGLEAMAAAAIERFGLAGRAILTSFDSDVLVKIRDVAPHIRRLSSLNLRSVEAKGLRRSVEDMLAVSDILAVEKSLLRDEWDLLSEMIPEEKLGVWVPNDEDEIAYWMSKPIHQLTTDRPDIAVAVRQRLFDLAI